MAKRIWMEGVKMIDSLDKELSLLMEKEGLHNHDIYYKNYEDFEELPLYTRVTHIAFLSQLSFNDKNKILIKKGIELITLAVRESVNYLSATEQKEYFICLTLSDWDDYDEINCLDVRIFITRRKKWILSYLKLKHKSSLEENLAREYLFSLGANEFEVFVPNNNEKYKRVYIINKSFMKNVSF
jgi:hypothetical protein